MPLLPTILLCAALGGIASAAFAVAFLWVPEAASARILPHFVSFATGALIGAALLALLPEAIEGAGPGHAHAIGFTLVLGLGVFFLIEKLVLWWHTRAHEEGSGAHSTRTEDTGDPAAAHAAHQHEHGHQHARDLASGVLVLIADSVHNLLDGVLIAAAFLTSNSLGVVTTFAVAAHEIPHRVGDFAILVQAGLSRPRALWLNLATGLAAVVGAMVAYLTLRGAMDVLPYALAFAAAGFLYIAVAGLIPGLQRRADLRTSAWQVMLLALGVVVVAYAARMADQ
jgi:zinc and cadmium transporter